MMKKLDDRERRIVLLAVLGMLVALPVLGAAGLLDPDPVSRAVFLLVLTSLMAWGAWRRSRVLSGMALFLVAFGPWGRSWFAGMPLMGIGMWLWFRGRPSQEEIEERRKARDAKIAERRAAKVAARRAGNAAGSGAGPVTKAPKPNKRYTPPSSRR